MKHYLEFTNDYGVGSWKFYDSETGSSIGVDKWDIQFEKFDDVEWHLGYDLKEGYKFITREEFEAVYIQKVNKLNEIAKDI